MIDNLKAISSVTFPLIDLELILQRLLSVSLFYLAFYVLHLGDPWQHHIFQKYQHGRL